jgi:aspartokinase/homoserine dehydrogenase 1
VLVDQDTIIYYYLRIKTVHGPTEWIDAWDVLIVKSDSSGLGEKGAASTGGVMLLYDISAQRMEEWWQGSGLGKTTINDAPPIVVVTGFVAKTLEGVPTTLKRSGSNYSATIFAKLCEASRVTMWKNTNGVYTAFPIASLKYNKAMALAYFGAQVLYSRQYSSVCAKHFQSCL